MDETAIPERRKKWFRWGLLLTGISSLPLLVGVIRIVHSMRQVPENEAIGLRGIAGGLVEVYSTFGLILAIVLPFVAIILLARSFAEAHRARGIFSVVCICWSALLLAIPAWTIWIVWDKQLLR